MKKHEVILARQAGKMILQMPDTTDVQVPSIQHDLDAMSTFDKPPRSPEVLWDLAKERKKINGSGNQPGSEVTRYTITGDLFNLHVPEDLKRYHYQGFNLTGTTKITPLLHSAKESETPMLPITRSLPILHGKGR